MRVSQFAASCFLLSLLFLAAAPAANAQSANTLGQTLNQISQFLQPPNRAKGPGVRNGLAPVSTDSFIYEAGKNAELIYGDESTNNGPPPYELFTKDHRINSGIYDRRDAGLTTGHGSYMPDAVGRDEFNGQEWDESGARGWNQKLALANAKPYIVPGVPANSNQFPTGYQKRDWTNGQIDEDRWGPPLPLVWNAQNAGNPKADFWFPIGNGNWENNRGVIIDRDGTATFTQDVQYVDGTYQGFAGDVRYRDGRWVSWTVSPTDPRRNVMFGIGTTF